MPKGTKNNVVRSANKSAVCFCGRVFTGKTMNEVKTKMNIHGKVCDKTVKTWIDDPIVKTIHGKQGKLTQEYYHKMDKMIRDKLDCS